MRYEEFKDKDVNAIREAMLNIDYDGVEARRCNNI
jgi:hypothetical protein